MTKNNGIKILAGSIVCTVILILINSKPSTSSPETTTNPNNFGEAIASQFSDNIRDVSARLLETEKKLSQMHQENKALHQQLKQPKANLSTALNDEVEQLKEQIKNL